MLLCIVMCLISFLTYEGVNSTIFYLTNDDGASHNQIDIISTNKPSDILQTGVINLFGVLFNIVFLQYFRKMQRETELICDEETTTYSDFTVCI